MFVIVMGLIKYANNVSFGLCLISFFMFWLFLDFGLMFYFNKICFINLRFKIQNMILWLYNKYYLICKFGLVCSEKMKSYVGKISLIYLRYSLFVNTTFMLAEDKQNWIHAAISVDGNRRNAVVPILEVSLDGITCNPVFSDPRFATLVIGVLQIQFYRRNKALETMGSNLSEDSYQYWRNTYAYGFLDTLLDNTYGYGMMQYINPQGAVMLFSLLTAVGILADPIGDAYNDLADRTEALINRYEGSRNLYTKFQDTFLIIERRNLETYRAYVEDKRYAEMFFGHYNGRVSFKEIDGEYGRSYIPKANLEYKPYEGREHLTSLGYKIPSQEGPGPGGIWVHLDKTGNITRPPKIDGLDPKLVLSPQMSPAIAVRVFLRATDPETINKLSEAFNFLAGGG